MTPQKPEIDELADPRPGPANITRKLDANGDLTISARRASHNTLILDTQHAVLDRVEMIELAGLLIATAHDIPGVTDLGPIITWMEERGWDPQPIPLPYVVRTAYADRHR